MKFKTHPFRTLCLFTAVILASPIAISGGAAPAVPASPPDGAGPKEAALVMEPFENAPRMLPRAAAAALASHPVRVRFDSLKGLRSGQDIRLQYSATEHWRGTVDRVEMRHGDSYSVFGNIDGEGMFVFTVDSGGFVGTIMIPQRNILADLRKVDGDRYWLHFFDGRKARQFKCGLPAPPSASTRKERGKEPETVTPALGDPVIERAQGDPVPQQDIMVLYTQGLLDTFPDSYPNTPLPTAIQHFIDFSNQCYVNSGVQLRLRLVYRALVDQNFSEAGRDRYWLLDHLTWKTDGYMDHIHSWRSTYRADLVCLLYSQDIQKLNGGGLAWVLQPETFDSGVPADWYDGAFCVVEGLWEPSSVEPPVSGMVPTEFAHEIGHNQGLDHDCENGFAVGDQVRPYAFGWRFFGNSTRTGYITIMSYANGIYSAASPIPYFSNPAVSFDGQPTGNATTAGCPGTTGSRNAEALNVTADFMSRLSLKPLDPWVDFNYLGLIQNGRFETPWKALSSAVADIPVTGAFNTPEPPVVTIKGAAATGPMSITITKRLTLKAHGGKVVIGGS